MMGNHSSFDKAIENQERYVNNRMKDADVNKLKNLRTHGMFGDKNPTVKYSDRQIKKYLREEYNYQTPHSVSRYDLMQAGISKSRHYR